MTPPSCARLKSSPASRGAVHALDSSVLQLTFLHAQCVTIGRSRRSQDPPSWTLFPDQLPLSLPPSLPPSLPASHPLSLSRLKVGGWGEWTFLLLWIQILARAGENAPCVLPRAC